MSNNRGTIFTRESTIGPAVSRRQALRTGGLLIGSLGLGALLTACGSAQSTSAVDQNGKPLAPIKIGAVQPGTAGSVIDPITTEFGLDAKHGLTLLRDGGGGVGTGQENLLTGLLDTFAFGPLGATEANNAGHDIVIVGPQLLNHGRWLVPADSDITSVEDLRGKRVGVQPASSDTYKAAALGLAVNGIDFEREFQIFPGQPIANLALYERGDLDAIIAIEPNATRLVAQGSRQIASVSQLWQKGTGDNAPLFLNGAAFQRSWLTQNRDTAARFVALRSEANSLITADPSLLSTYYEAYGIPATEEAAIDLLPERLAEIYPSTWDAAVFANMDKQIQVALDIGLLESTSQTPVYESLS
ncbi:ABC transporter substrate-binding protein [Rhodococcoides fascians]|uniref:ABC transporter substrate-binding protein n=1 Tax=Rhodococcoides fascians TaxID=1828 RepID=UPI0009B8A7E2|nr:PhnD/SsuA/transferrin family substrate-binding protein [Rhodococcus fascians]